MPSKPGSYKSLLERGEDGLFHCTVPGCDQPGYKLAQHLGLHNLHKHGIPGKSRSHEGVPRTTGAPRGRPPKNRPPALSAEDICTAALEALSPSGSIPIHDIPAFTEWVRQTEMFVNKLLGR